MPPNSALSRYRDGIYLLLACTAVVMLWVLPAGGSLWLDETLVYFVIKDGFAEVLERTHRYHGQSPLFYVLAWLSSQLTGISEFALRLPSLICTLLALHPLYRVTRHLLDREVGILALVVFLYLGEAVVFFSYLRPYGLGIVCCLYSVMYLLRWLGSERKRELVLFAIFTTLSIYAHYFFGFILLLETLYLWLNRGEKRSKILSFLLASAGVAILLIPAWPQILALANRSETLSFAPMPSLLTFFRTLLLPWTTATLVFSLLLAWIFCPLRLAIINFQRKDILWIGLWWLLPPLCCYLFSIVSGSSLFTVRYYIVYTPALAILIASGLRLIESDVSRVAVLCLFCVITLSLSDIRPRLVREDWRSAVQHVRQISDKISVETTASQTEVPILFFSGLIESKNVEWLSDPAQKDYLTAPLQYYSVSGPVGILPLLPDSPIAQRYLRSEVLPLLERSSEVILILLENLSWKGPEGAVYPHKYFQDLIEEVGFQARESRSFEQVWIIEFERKSARSTE